MNPFQLMQMLQSANDPMAIIQRLANQNPMMYRAMQMVQGKNQEQIRETIQNLARQKGMSENDLSQFLSQFGVRL